MNGPVITLLPEARLNSGSKFVTVKINELIVTSTLVGFIVIGFWLMAFLLAWLSYKSDSKRFSVIWAVLSGICALTFMGFFPFVFWIALIIMVSIRWRRQS